MEQSHPLSSGVSADCECFVGAERHPVAFACAYDSNLISSVFEQAERISSNYPAIRNILLASVGVST